MNKNFCFYFLEVNILNKLTQYFESGPRAAVCRPLFYIINNVIEVKFLKNIFWSFINYKY